MNLRLLTERIAELSSDAATTLASGAVTPSRAGDYKFVPGSTPACDALVAAYIRSECAGRPPRTLPPYDDIRRWALDRYRIEKRTLEGFNEGFGWPGPVHEEDEDHLDHKGAAFAAGFAAGRELGRRYVGDTVRRHKLTCEGRVATIYHLCTGGYKLRVECEWDDDEVDWFDNGGDEKEFADFAAAQEAARAFLDEGSPSYDEPDEPDEVVANALDRLRAQKAELERAKAEAAERERAEVAQDWYRLGREWAIGHGEYQTLAEWARLLDSVGRPATGDRPRGATGRPEDQLSQAVGVVVRIPPAAGLPAALAFAHGAVAVFRQV